jgi:type IVB pilus formation R64 PilN family outer membrane protein
MNLKFLRYLTLLTVLALQACSSFDSQDAQAHRAATERAQSAQSQVRQPMALPPLVKDEQQVRFVSRSVPLKQSAVLPPGIQNVTVRYPGRHNLSTIADVLTRTLGVVVVMTPDALMDPRAFTPVRNLTPVLPVPPGLASPTGQPLNLDAMNLANSAAMQAGAGRLGLTAEQATNTFELNYNGPLTELLDWIANQAHLNWSYENDRIVFRRVVTQFITVRALPTGFKGSRSFTIGSGGNNSSLSAEFADDVWEGLGKTIPMMLSATGQVQLDAKLGVATVRDAISNVQEVERYIQQIHNQYMRQISIHVEAIQVDLSTEAQSGIDWADISARSGQFRSSGPAFLKGSSDPGVIGVFRGATSQLLLKNLERYGRVSTMYSTVVNTMHRQNVPLSVSNSRTYVRSITAGTVTSGTVSGPSLAAADIITGFSLNLLPVILDSNRILLETAIGISSMRELATFSTGSGFGQATIQQPDVDSFLNVQRVGLRLGETLVLMGYEYEDTRNSAADVVGNKLPTSRLSKSNKKSVVILLTPTMNES